MSNPQIESARARLLEDHRRAKAQGHTVQAWQIKAALSGFEIAVDAMRAP